MYLYIIPSNTQDQHRFDSMIQPKKDLDTDKIFDKMDNGFALWHVKSSRPSSRRY